MSGKRKSPIDLDEQRRIDTRQAHEATKDLRLAIQEHRNYLAEGITGFIQGEVNKQIEVLSTEVNATLNEAVADLKAEVADIKRSLLGETSKGPTVQEVTEAVALVRFQRDGGQVFLLPKGADRAQEWVPDLR